MIGINNKANISVTISMAILLVLMAVSMTAPSYAGWHAPTDENETENDSTPQQTSYSAPATWSFELALKNQIFPSAIISLAGVEDKEFNALTSVPMVQVVINDLKEGDKVTIELSSPTVLHQSKTTAVYENSAQEFIIHPKPNYNFQNLLKTYQAYPENITLKLFINDEYIDEKSQLITVRPINDCLYGITTSDGSFISLREQFVAYINEEHPALDKILSQALQYEYIDSFAGYQGNWAEVLIEIDAIWETLQTNGMDYSNIVTTSVEKEDIHSQHVRMIGEINTHRQANCVDGSILLASLFRKIGLRTYLVLVPGHMFLGVRLSPESDITYLETTMISSSDIGDAFRAARITAEEAMEDETINIFDIDKIRQYGILPLKGIY